MITQSPRSILSLVCTAGAVAAAALAGITMPSPASAALPTIYELGKCCGYASAGVAINDAGQVAGWSYVIPSDDSPYRAFRYDGTPGSGGVMHDLGTLGGSDSSATAINNSGQVAGWSYIAVGSTEPDIQRAFLYTGTPGSGGVMHDLGTLGGSQGWDSGSWAGGVNDSGQVVGWSTRASEQQIESHAFLYTGTPGSGGMMHDLGTLGGTDSEARAINNIGQITGSSVTAGNVAVHAYRYDGTPGHGGIMHDLGTLGGLSSYGSAINTAGQVAGYSYTAGGVAHAFLYTGTPGSGGVMHDLGTLGGNSYATAINDWGQVVGWSELVPGGLAHPFLYTGTPGVDGRMIDLEAWLDANNPTEGAKWFLGGLYAEMGLNNNGLITGPGYPGGAYVLDASSILVPPDLPGDFNFDGMVDAADYTVWRDGLGTTYTMADYDAWKSHFGQTAGDGSAASGNAAVPEPPACLLGVLVFGCCLARRQRLQDFTRQSAIPDL